MRRKLKKPNKPIELRAYVWIHCYDLNPKYINNVCVGSEWSGDWCMCEVLMLNINRGTMRVRYSNKYGGKETHDVEVPNDLRLMQFTGLYDKNSVKIFEGDFLSFDEDVWGGKFDAEVVTMDKIRGEWNLSGTLGDVGNFRQVVGNIWE